MQLDVDVSPPAKYHELKAGLKGTRYLTMDFVQKRDECPFGVLSLKIPKKVF